MRPEFGVVAAIDEARTERPRPKLDTLIRQGRSKHAHVTTVFHTYEGMRGVYGDVAEEIGGASLNVGATATNSQATRGDKRSKEAFPDLEVRCWRSGRPISRQMLCRCTTRCSRACFLWLPARAWSSGLVLRGTLIQADRVTLFQGERAAAIAVTAASCIAA